MAVSVILLSASGNSKNMLVAANYCNEKKLSSFLLQDLKEIINLTN